MLPRSLSLPLATLALATSLLAQSEILPIGGGPPPHFPGGALTRILHAVPPSPNPAGVSVNILIHRADSQPAYAVDFVASYSLHSTFTITGIQIHRSVAGGNGPVVLDFGLGAQVSGTLTNAMAAVLADIEANPSAYYVEIDTNAAPGGVIRAPLGAAQQSVTMGVMIPSDAIAAAQGTESGTGTAMATITRDASGAISSAQVMFDVIYQFPTSVTLTGLAIHFAPAHFSGAVVLDSGLTSISLDPTSREIRLTTEIDTTQPGAAAALEAMFADPSNYYLELDTATAPAGAMRTQLARASRSSYQVGLGVQNAGALGLATPPFADGQITVDVLRSSSGDLQAAMVTFDLDYTRYGPNTQFTQLSFSAVNGPLSGPSPTAAASAQGNIYQVLTVNSPAVLASLEEALTTLDSGVAVQTAAGLDSISGSLLTGQLNINGALKINTIQNAAGDSTVKTAAPGSLISLFGSFPVNPVDVAGLHQPWPTSLNGAYVTVGGRPIPIGYLSTTQINALIPPDMTTGPQTVQFFVSTDPTTHYASNSVQLTISPQAPAIFVSAGGPAVVHLSGAPVNAAQPAEVGELVLVYLTGATANPDGSFPLVSATVGSNAAAVENVLALPASPGIEVVGVRIPILTIGSSVPLQLNVAGTASNSVNIPVQ